MACRIKDRVCSLNPLDPTVARLAQLSRMRDALTSLHTKVLAYGAPYPADLFGHPRRWRLRGAGKSYELSA